MQKNQNSKKHLKRRWTSLVTGEMQIKPTRRQHLTHTHPGWLRYKGQIVTWVGESLEKMTVFKCGWYKCEMVQPPWRTLWWFLKKGNKELPYSAIPRLGIYPKELSTGVQTKPSPRVLQQHQAQQPTSRKEPKDGWINRMGSIHAMEYSSAIKQNQVQLHASGWIYPENIKLRERNQSQRATSVGFHPCEMSRMGNPCRQKAD